jgi:hypothetical protein
MKMTCAPISFATLIATYSGEYGSSGYTRRTSPYVRGGAGDAGEAEHVVVVAIRRIDGDRRPGLVVLDVLDQLGRLGGALDEDDLRPTGAQRLGEPTRGGGRVVADGEPVQRLAEHLQGGCLDGGRVEAGGRIDRFEDVRVGEVSHRRLRRTGP